ERPAPKAPPAASRSAGGSAPAPPPRAAAAPARRREARAAAFPRAAPASRRCRSARARGPRSSPAKIAPELRWRAPGGGNDRSGSCGPILVDQGEEQLAELLVAAKGAQLDRAFAGPENSRDLGERHLFEAVEVDHLALRVGKALERRPHRGRPLLRGDR